MAVDAQATAYVGCRDTATKVVVHAIERSSGVAPGWPVRLTGADVGGGWNRFEWPWDSGNGIQIGPEGTVYVGVLGTPDRRSYSIHAFRPDGRVRTGWPRKIAGAYQGFQVAPDGAVVAWWYERARGELTLDAQRTRFTTIGPDGRTFQGWPIGSTGAASGPVISSDGSIFYVSATGKVWGHDRAGKVLDGWPYELPARVPPELRKDGRLQFVVDGGRRASVIVLTTRGRMASGWPFRMQGTISAPLCDTGGPSDVPRATADDGTLYFAPRTPGGQAAPVVASSVVAIDSRGRILAGWPYRLPPGWAVTAMALDADGQVVISAVTGNGPTCSNVWAEVGITIAADGHLVSEAPPSSLESVYAALRPEGLRTSHGSVVYRRGQQIDMLYELVNRSGSQVALPHVNHFGDWYWAAGTLQNWIERRGSDTTITCLPQAGRKGTWYATGGWIKVYGYPVTLEPGDSLDSGATVDADLTACLPPGTYRYHVEYRALAEDERPPLAAQVLEFTLTE